MTETVDNTGLEAIFDWLEFTLHDYSLERIINDVLELETNDFIELPRGKSGYKKQLIWNEGTIFILHNDATDDLMGVHIIITGTACRQYEKNGDLRDLIIRAIETDGRCKFTRIDIAIDDKEGRLIDFQTFQQESEKGNISSKWYKYSLLLETKIADGQRLGRTLYYGSKKSAIFMRVYDKHLEQKKKQQKKKKQPTPLKEHVDWTRMEVVFREERAQLLAIYLLENEDVGRIMRGVLHNYIRFLEPPKSGNDTRKRRWETAGWWLKILGDVEKLKITLKPAKRTIEDMEEWLEKQVAPTLSAVMKAHEGETDWLYNMILEGATRLKPKHSQAVAKHLKK